MVFDPDAPPTNARSKAGVVSTDGPDVVVKMDADKPPVDAQKQKAVGFLSFFYSCFLLSSPPVHFSLSSLNFSCPPDAWSRRKRGVHLVLCEVLLVLLLVWHVWMSSLLHGLDMERLFGL